MSTEKQNRQLVTGGKGASRSAVLSEADAYASRAQGRAVARVSRTSSFAGRGGTEGLVESGDSDARARLRAVANVVLIYVHLWILEGAARKWVGGTEEIMYLARDGFLILGMAAVFLRWGGRRSSALAGWVLLWALAVYIMISYVFQDVPALVLVAGLRNYTAPFLLILFVWPDLRELGTELYVRVSRILQLYAVAFVPLVIAQVSTPKQSVFNAQVGGEEAVFSTADGVVRASGTFTSPVGLALFSTLVAAVSLANLLDGRGVRKYQVLGLLSACLMITLGGSRSGVLGVAVVIVVATVLTLVKASSRTVTALAGAFVAGAIVIFLAMNFLPGVVQAFQTRFETAAASEDTVGRVVNGVFGFATFPFGALGDGAGTRSTFGIQLGSGMEWIESDSLRWVSELGFVGFVLALGRLMVAAALTLKGVFNASRLSYAQGAVGAALLPTVAFGSITSLPLSHGYFAIAAVLLALASTARPDRSKLN